MTRSEQDNMRDAEQERARIVAWLRSDPGPVLRDLWYPTREGER